MIFDHCLQFLCCHGFCLRCVGASLGMKRVQIKYTFVVNEKANIDPAKWQVGRCLSTKKRLFSGSALIYSKDLKGTVTCIFKLQQKVVHLIPIPSRHWHRCEGTKGSQNHRLITTRKGSVQQVCSQLRAYASWHGTHFDTLSGAGRVGRTRQQLTSQLCDSTGTKWINRYRTNWLQIESTCPR